MWRSLAAGCLAALAASSIKQATGDRDNQIITISLYATFILSNVLMWYLQLKGMSKSETTINPILLFTTSNFIATGIFGWLFHNETHGITWFIGLILLLIGTFIVQSSTKEKVE